MMTRFTVVFDGVLDGKRLEDFTIDGATAVAYWDGDAIRQQVCFQHLAVYGAIDEITRLREALKHYACNCAEGKCESSDVDSFTCGSRARAALAEKGEK